jgi:hypothetical protein
MLARLDQMHFEGSLAESEEPVRAKLHQAVRSRDERTASSCFGKLGRVEGLGEVSLEDSPTIARGRRRLALLRGAAKSELRDAIEREDAVAVREILSEKT